MPNTAGNPIRLIVTFTSSKSWLIDNRWEIYKSDGCVYDTEKAEDIPQDIFEIRDNLMKIKE